MIIALTDIAGWRDLPEVWGWTLELAADPATETHQRAASLFGLAATSAWLRGELARADRLARQLASGGEGTWQCQAALALATLSAGNLTDASTLATEAAAHATRTDQNLGIGASPDPSRGSVS